MADASLIAVLNDLLAAEQRNLAPRLFESTVFVSRIDLDLYNLVRSMAHSCRAHCAALTELILDLGGQPRPPVVDPSTGDLHFLEISRLLPRLVASQERLEATYQQAGPHVATEPRAASIVERILARHRDDLEKLRALAAPPARALAS